MPIIAVFNPAPGSGSTATARHLLAAFGRRGLRPWGIDLDASGDLSRAFLPYPPPADESMRAFFADAMPLSHLAHITRSGIVVCPAHPDLASLDRTLGRGLPILTRLRRALRAPGTVTGPVVIDCPANVHTLTLSAMFAAHLTLVPLGDTPASAAAALRVERAMVALEAAVREPLPRKYVLTQRADSTGTVAPPELEHRTVELVLPRADASRGDDDARALAFDALLEDLDRLGLLAM